MAAVTSGSFRRVANRIQTKDPTGLTPGFNDSSSLNAFVALAFNPVPIRGAKHEIVPPGLRSETNRSENTVQQEQRRGGLPAKSPQTVQPEATLQKHSFIVIQL
jgi:hypothetical protein